MKTKSKKIINKIESTSGMSIPREQWEKHFKLAIKAGHPPEIAKDKKTANQFDKSGWAW